MISAQASTRLPAETPPSKPVSLPKTGQTGLTAQTFFVNRLHRLLAWKPFPCCAASSVVRRRYWIADLLKAQIQNPALFSLQRVRESARDKQQKQRRQHRHTAGNQRREARHKPRFRNPSARESINWWIQASESAPADRKCKRLCSFCTAGRWQHPLRRPDNRVELGFASVRPVSIENHDIAGPIRRLMA